MKTGKILLLTILLLWTSVAAAQRIKGGAGFVKVGITNAPGAGLVLDQIAPVGVSGFSDQFYVLGGEGYYRTGNIVLALDGHISAQNARSSGTNYGEGYTYFGHAKLGWIVGQGARYWVYPTVGFGTAALAMTTYTKTGNDAKAENRQNRYLYRPSFDIGLNADYLLSKSRTTDPRFGGVLLGLRAGYHISQQSSSWRNDANDRLAGLPSYGNRGYYVTLAIGGGGFVKK